jgi:NAD dependent epimerase/dehydratase family enzyme
MVPGKLLTSGFQFQFARMEEALRDLQERTLAGK